MAEQIDLIVTLRKTVDTIQQARNLYDAIKGYFSDQPQITVTGHATTHYDQPEDPPT